MIAKARRIGGRIVSFVRKHHFRAKLHRPRGSSVFWVPGLVIFRDASHPKQNSKKGIRSRGATFAVFFAAFFLLTMSAELPMGLNAIPIISSLGIWGLFFVGVVRGRRDFKRYRHASDLVESPSQETATEALDYIDDYQGETQYNALQTILPVCEGAPGKVLKRSEKDASEVADVLVDQLEHGEPRIQKLSAAVIKWFTRDYGEEFGPQAQSLRDMLDYPDSDVQANLAIALGNIGAKSDDPSSFAKALTPVVKDEDADVRQSAAYALQSLPCKQSAKMLNYLSEDTSPDVRQQAQESLNRLTG
ncbi:HEAT repeat domain-containing protein [Halobacterium salinarum]|uniref:HEAT repeat domain-containing protein n=1 Tax=Halobacterium salinarum TaxID=2242 RepID=UPI001F221E75|nr:HEAT repeat domain-containing protein [Halobacterium salinarum]MCF2208080.1 HEAT repeat domain-containing protein [Halobacterium salinarum]